MQQLYKRSNTYHAHDRSTNICACLMGSAAWLSLCVWVGRRSFKCREGRRTMYNVVRKNVNDITIVLTVFK